MAHLFMEAVSALQHTDVVWSHVIMTDDARILNIQLQSRQRQSQVQLTMCQTHPQDNV